MSINQFFFSHKNFAKNGPLTNLVRASVNKILIKKSDLNIHVLFCWYESIIFITILICISYVLKFVILLTFTIWDIVIVTRIGQGNGVKTWI